MVIRTSHRDFDTSLLPGLHVEGDKVGHYVRLLPNHVRFRFVCIKHRKDLKPVWEALDDDGNLTCMNYGYSYDLQNPDMRLDFNFWGLYCPDNNVDNDPESDCANQYRVMLDLNPIVDEWKHAVHHREVE